MYSVIVCYNPDWNHVLSNLIQVLSKSGVKAVVVDNSDESLELTGDCDFEYLSFNVNLGIAEAQNRGIKLALNQGAQAIVFFDQDSLIKEGFIQTLISPVIDKDEDIVAPIFKSIKYGFYYDILSCLPSGGLKKIPPEKGRDFYTNIAISSGTVVNSSVFSKVGLMNSELFIDYVDTEWCLRAYHYGFKVYVNTSAVMEHEIGDHTISIGRYSVPVHSPQRRYYRLRNSFILARFTHVPRKLMIREVIFSFLHHLVLIYFEGKKIDYLKSMYCGVRDGVLNRSGKHDLCE
ncbi:glycosyltransferase family 2 protein [Agarivorans albus]|uniref:glycosyltransferase family 2 protein n=1 Tax=Agarivorans albus TaxID=182262 RepID=UPI001BFD2C12|nr:glycosyltransferase family 2 protein [Agarivorans albus]